MARDSYRHVQDIAKRVHEHLGGYINSESTESSIAVRAQELLEDFGAIETWYHGVPVFVLLGSRSCLSISGKGYTPATEPVGETNLITVDLSPRIGDVWGDCARSYFVEHGLWIESPTLQAFMEGHSVERALHESMMAFVTPETRFSELYDFGNAQIEALGYENLDFLNNLGHSIETDMRKRRFIDKGCHEFLGNVPYFTFEPHIRKHGGQWGFKHENIYYFDRPGLVVEL